MKPPSCCSFQEDESCVEWWVIVSLGQWLLLTVATVCLLIDQSVVICGCVCVECRSGFVHREVAVFMGAPGHMADWGERTLSIDGHLQHGLYFFLWISFIVTWRTGVTIANVTVTSLAVSVCTLLKANHEQSTIVDNCYQLQWHYTNQHDIQI